MTSNAQIFDEIVNTRRSTRKFDPTAPFESDAVARSIDRAILSPNSSNMQLWEFYRVKDKSKIEEMSKFCFGQGAASTSNELLIVVTRLDKWKSRQQANFTEIKRQFEGKEIGKTEQRALDYYGKLMPLFYSHDRFNFINTFKKIFTWFRSFKGLTYWQVSYYDLRTIVHKSAALAAQTFMLSMTAEGYSTCPMEGFDSAKVKKMMNLPAGAEINMIIGMGVGMKEGVYGKRFRIPREEVVFEL
jgi:nitroreductase